MSSVNLESKRATFKDHWQPRPVEQFTIELRDGTVELEPGELFVVPDPATRRVIHVEPS